MIAQVRLRRRAHGRIGGLPRLLRLGSVDHRRSMLLLDLTPLHPRIVPTLQHLDPARLRRHPLGDIGKPFQLLRAPGDAGLDLLHRPLRLTELHLGLLQLHLSLLEIDPQPWQRGFGLQRRAKATEFADQCVQAFGIGSGGFTQVLQTRRGRLQARLCVSSLVDCCAPRADRRNQGDRTPVGLQGGPPRLHLTASGFQLGKPCQGTALAHLISGDAPRDPKVFLCGSHGGVGTSGTGPDHGDLSRQRQQRGVHGTERVRLVEFDLQHAFALFDHVGDRVVSIAAAGAGTPAHDL